MNRIKCAVVLATSGLLAGCWTEKPPVAPAEGEEVQDVALVLERESVQDDNFVLYFDENPDKCTFHPKRPGV